MEVAAPCPLGSCETMIKQFAKFDSEQFDEHSKIGQRRVMARFTVQYMRTHPGQGVGFCSKPQ
jgi:hypothetical protein